MELAITGCMIVAGWLFLSVISDERERALQYRALQEQRANPPVPPAPPARNRLDKAKN